jgi:hypothetical protein
MLPENNLTNLLEIGGRRCPLQETEVEELETSATSG